MSIYPYQLRLVPDYLKTQEMCNEAVRREPYALGYVPDCFKAHEICNEAVRREPCLLENVTGHLKTPEMCNKAAREKLYVLKYIPDHLKTQEMCNKAVREKPCVLKCIPDWFVTQQQLKIWYDDDDPYINDEIIEWYKAYQKRKSQKLKIKEELLPIACHPSRWWDWCMSEDERKETDQKEIKRWPYTATKKINSITRVFGYVGTYQACDHVINGTITICPCSDNSKA